MKAASAGDCEPDTPNASFTVMVRSPGGVTTGGLTSAVVVRQPLTMPTTLGAKLIQPMFSPHAEPPNRPVTGSIVTPPPAGAKLIQPTFSPHAYPERRPLVSLTTPLLAGAKLIHP